MSRRLLSVLLGSSLLLAAHGAGAQSVLPPVPPPQSATKPLTPPSDPNEIRFSKPAKDARELAVIASLVPAMAADPGLQTAVLDLDGDRKVEVLARATGKDFCQPDGKTCRTVAFKFLVNKWVVVFDRPANKITMGPQGFGGMAELRVDGGQEIHAFDGMRYRIDVAASGKVVALQPAPASATALLLAQFGPGAEKLYAGGGLRILVGAADLGPKGSQVVVAQLEGAGACGMVLGCPIRILQPRNGTYETLMQGSSAGKIAVLPVQRDGWRDVMVEAKGGHAVYGWGGSRYGLVERQAEGVAK